MFTSEQEMSLKFEKFIKENFGNAYIKECSWLFWVPDYVFYSKTNIDISVISFELKLKNWKQAIKQAFRYKNFSHASYVVMPMQNISIAENNIDVFRRYNIWLILFDTKGDICILFKPEISAPYSEFLTQKLLGDIKKSKRKAKNIDMLFA